MTTERWTRVLSAGELRAGMVIKAVMIDEFGARRFTLLRFLPDHANDVEYTDERLTGGRGPGWRIYPKFLGYDRVSHESMLEGIGAGRLFRLETDLDASEANPYLAHAPKKAGVR